MQLPSGCLHTILMTRLSGERHVVCGSRLNGLKAKLECAVHLRMNQGRACLRCAFVMKAHSGHVIKDPHGANPRMRLLTPPRRGTKQTTDGIGEMITQYLTVSVSFSLMSHATGGRWRSATVLTVMPHVAVSLLYPCTIQDSKCGLAPSWRSRVVTLYPSLLRCPAGGRGFVLCLRAVRWLS